MAYTWSKASGLDWNPPLGAFIYHFIKFCRNLPPKQSQRSPNRLQSHLFRGQCYSVPWYWTSVERKRNLLLKVQTGWGVQVEQGAMVAAGAVVHPGTVVPTGELWGGNPAVKLRDMKTDEVSYLPRLALAYTTLGGQHSKTTPKSLQVKIPALPSPASSHRRIHCETQASNSAGVTAGGMPTANAGVTLRCMLCCGR